MNIEHGKPTMEKRGPEKLNNRKKRSKNYYQKRFQGLALMKYPSGRQVRRAWKAFANWHKLTWEEHDAVSVQEVNAVAMLVKKREVVRDPNRKNLVFDCLESSMLSLLGELDEGQTVAANNFFELMKKTASSSQRN